MKKVIIYFLNLVLSFIIAMCTDNSITSNAELTVQILLTLLGLCITTYVFICSPISKAASKKIELKKEAVNLLKKLEDDMKAIFYITLIIIITSILKSTDFVLLKDPINLDFGLFIIKSFKLLTLNTVLTFSFNLGMLGFYDFISAIFKLTKGLLFVD